MKVAVLKEKKHPEKRVALTPDVVKTLVKAGFKCHIESSAGDGSGFYDSSYVAAGAVIEKDRAPLLGDANILLKVNAPSLDEVSLLKEGAVIISFMYAYTIPEIVEACNAKKISTFAMDAVPRISRAQKMDALSSQSNLAGYKAVLLGANALGKIFPLMMTAAGTITPARVLIFGAGVAGLQAVATAKRLGAVVEVTDVRVETKEQVESLGGRFLQVESDGVQTEGGYATEVSEEYLKKQKELISKHVAEADIVITTALVIGKKAPVLITEDMVKTMKPGSVIVDMAVESGGNCELSEFNTTIVKHGITLVGEANLPGLVAVNASELYAKNISTLLLHLADREHFKWDMDDEITKGSLITHNAEIVNDFTKEILNKNKA
ncbi:NAD(P) transhydrogenase subunit alpha [Arcticibacter pallidicorallinus]|uniref:NAD(P) transhydrogenase subunit alpha part 1 n=1 Tax=Arcticibacter pallidicorallinus TaxID=1259464 RepID=A0A2T0UC70_9SPHI|nr:Re/Si-specific NAD(P)(+) transhydrogenase subunit alpha [Arcticibacter pallidicorallinus]PRY55536.1 NAD(P) transhydrogenase subunit alpha [Arcticibacter pallidicorallinus]